MLFKYIYIEGKSYTIVFIVVTTTKKKLAPQSSEDPIPKITPEWL